MHTAALRTEDIAKLLDQRKLRSLRDQAPLPDLFAETLRVANQFVPSEAGSVLLDEPRGKLNDLESATAAELVFVACFGDRAEQLIGRRMPTGQGIVGQTYRSGVPYLSPDVKDDDHFCHEFDELTCYETRSVICVPIRLEASTCGVLEMINRRGRTSYVRSDLDLLQIFAAYISTSLSNVLDRNRYRELAKRDDLTGLYNDRYFDLRLSDEMDKAECQASELSLIFVDIDYFKRVTDRHGHLVGSQTLRQLGALLYSTVPPERGVVARYGGDEFIILVPGADLEQARRLGEEVRRRIEETPLVIDIGAEGSPPVRIEKLLTASVGVASFWASSITAKRTLPRVSQFIRFADQAMYTAKQAGKNQVCCHLVKDSVGSQAPARVSSPGL